MTQQLPSTSLDVARLAGVSQSAVSRAFTPGASISEATRRKVMEAAMQLGYRPNAHARSLITGRSRLIGLVVSHLDNLLYPVVLERLALALQQDDYHVMLFVNEEDRADRLIEQILQYHVDAIVLAASQMSSGLAQECARQGIPVLMFNRVASAGTEQACHSVRSDNFGGGALVANHLAAQGCRRIAYIAGSEQSSTNREREAGFLQGLSGLGQRLHARVVGDYSRDAARRATLALCADANNRPDAIFAASDHMALAVIDTLRYELGLRVAQDVAVVGFDDVPQSSWAAYQLTTVAQSIDDMVTRSAELLRAQINATDPVPAQELIVPVTLKIRASSRKESLI